MDGLDPARIAEFAVWFIVFLFSLTLHEAAHALAARQGGDDTAYLGGQVTLNPAPHIRREPFGTLLMPIISWFFAGWMMGWASTPYDPRWARRYPRRQAVMSAAGPAANLLLSAVAFLVIALLLRAGMFQAPQLGLSISHLAEPASRFGPDSMLHPAAMALSIALSLNLLLFVFNLFPLPPLDGSGVVSGLFPDSLGRVIETLSGNPMMSLLVLLVVSRVVGFVYAPVLGFAVALLPY